MNDNTDEKINNIIKTNNKNSNKSKAIMKKKII